MLLPFNCVHEPVPGEKWAHLFEKLWPHYRHWFLAEGIFSRPGYLTSYNGLKDTMPELAPIYEQLVALAGGGDMESRFLSMYCPPAYMSGCSQIAWTGDTNALIRNYDYNPAWFESLLMNTNWLRPVIGVSDCAWGLLDGMNDSGLVASLTFGGRKILSKGFGIPLIIRYVLETCNDVPEATRTLLRLPVHMAYNVTLLDRKGRFTTIFMSPDRPSVVTDSPIGVNHQAFVEWPEYAEITGTIERNELLEKCLANNKETADTMVEKFLQSPLYNTKYEKSFGTLYTARYNPKEGSVDLHWPRKTISQSFDNFTEGRFLINLNSKIKSKLVL